MSTKKRQPKQGEIKQLTLRLSVEGWQQLAHLAINEKTSIHAFILDAINEKLARKKLPPIS